MRSKDRAVGLQRSPVPALPLPAPKRSSAAPAPDQPPARVLFTDTEDGGRPAVPQSRRAAEADTIMVDPADPAAPAAAAAGSGAPGASQSSGNQAPSHLGPGPATPHHPLPPQAARPRA